MDKVLLVILQGADASMMWHSVIESTKLNNLDVMISSTALCPELNYRSSANKVLPSVTGQVTEGVLFGTGDYWADTSKLRNSP